MIIANYLISIYRSICAPQQISQCQWFGNLKHVTEPVECFLNLFQWCHCKNCCRHSCKWNTHLDVDFFYVLKHLQNIDKRFVLYFKSCTFFHLTSLAQSYKKGMLTDIVYVLDVLSSYPSLFSNKTRLFSPGIDLNIVPLRKAEQHLESMLDSKDSTELYLAARTAKLFLIETLNCKDHNSQLSKMSEWKPVYTLLYYIFGRTNSISVWKS